MHQHLVTTPFGRRPASLAQIAAHAALRDSIAEAAEPGSNRPEAVEKWRLFRTLTEVRAALGVSDRALGVLNALLSFHPETALTLPQPDEPDPIGLVVFPSNRQLALRAHGMSEATLRRHLAALVEAGLIARRDSPNGKRYARKGGRGAAGEITKGTITHAFGFDLTPLVARAPEFEALAEEAACNRRRVQALKEAISLRRRDIEKLLALALDELDGAQLSADWEARRLRFMGLMMPIRRISDEALLARLGATLAALRAEIVSALESFASSQNSSGNDARIARLQSNTNADAYNDLEPASKTKGGDACVPPASTAFLDSKAPETKAFPETKSCSLGLVMEACPDVADYAPSGRVKTWSDFLEATAAIRSMIGISPDAFAEAQQALGRTEAHVAVATILQRSIHSTEALRSPGSAHVTVNGSPAIQSAGGYLRALTGKARAGEFALGPVLMALIGQRLKAKRGRGA
ncbi:MAG: plasmid replication protein RepC [Beijerinckiaceae bacterium]